MKDFNAIIETLFEENAHQVIIDGLYVKDEVTLDPTPEWLVKKYRYFNRRYFDNELSQLSEKDFTINGSNQEATFTDQEVYYSNKNNRVVTFSKPLILFSRFYKRTEKQCCEILLHEMIHIYVTEVCRVIEENNGHGENFVDKATYIRQFGWNVEVDKTDSSNLEIYRKTIDILYSSFLIAYPYKNNYMLISTPFNGVYNLDIIKGIKIYMMKRVQPLKSIPFFDEEEIRVFNDSIKEEKPKGCKSNREELDYLESSGIIKEIDLTSRLDESNSTALTYEEIEKLYGDTKVVLPNGLVKFRIRYVDYF